MSTDLQKTIEKVLPDVDFIIGFEKGSTVFQTIPLFIRKPEDISRMIWGSTCVQNPASYLSRYPGKKIGVCVKGCDSRSVVQLVSENLVPRENIIIIGLPCTGVVDPAKLKALFGPSPNIEAINVQADKVGITINGQEKSFALNEVLANKCLSCTYPNPVLADYTVGEEVTPRVTEPDYSDLDAFLALPIEERFAFWQKEMSRCIRCYACRNSCPLCVCRDYCVAHTRNPAWISQENTPTENMMFQVIHAIHLTGRCTECGECERACPMNIPVLMLKRQMNRSIKDIFGHESGIDPLAIAPLATFKIEEETIKEREL